MSTILAIAAHPDDETMLAGGTLAMYAAQGHAVYILATTRGESGEMTVRDITPWLEAKIAAALCHRTQHTMFLRNNQAATVREMIGAIESFHRCS